LSSKKKKPLAWLIHEGVLLKEKETKSPGSRGREGAGRLVGAVGGPKKSPGGSNNGNEKI